MDAEAFAEKLASEYAPYPKYEPGVYGVLGLFVAYITVLALGALGDFPMEKFEATMNSAVIVGFVVPYAYFWHLRRRYLKASKAEYEKLPRRYMHRADIAAVNDHPKMSKKVRAFSMGQWGCPCTIGFINE